MAGRIEKSLGSASLIAMLGFALSLSFGVPRTPDKPAIRTTVYSNQDGRYEFPRLESGTYTFRIALPREYRPFVKEKVAINGATAMDDIALTRVTKLELLPPTREIEAQITGSEWLASLSGSGEEKKP